MNAVRKIRRTFKISRYQVTLTVTLVAGKPLHIGVEWSKFPPKLSQADTARYRQLRNAILSDVARQVDERIMIADADAQGEAIYTILNPDGTIEIPDLSEVT